MTGFRVYEYEPLDVELDDGFRMLIPHLLEAWEPSFGDYRYDDDGFLWFDDTGFIEIPALNSSRRPEKP